MRRIGGILFLLLLTACEPEAATTTVEAETIGVEEVTTTSSTATSVPTTSTSAPPTSTTSTTVARPTTTVAPVRVTVATTVPVTRPAPVTSTTTRPAAGGCDPNYSGCVPIDSDVDCAGGSGNGPSFTSAKNIQIIGVDIYGLDGNDDDGIGCESPNR